MKKKKCDLSNEEFRDTLDALYTAAASVRGRDSMKSFLRDLLTPSERLMCGRRIVIGSKILNGESYEKIRRELKVGLGTIARVHKWLKGLEGAINEMKSELERRFSQNLKRKSFISRLKKKYPLYFLLFPN